MTAEPTGASEVETQGVRTELSDLTGPEADECRGAARLLVQMIADGMPLEDAQVAIAEELLARRLHHMIEVGTLTAELGRKQADYDLLVDDYNEAVTSLTRLRSMHEGAYYVRVIRELAKWFNEDAARCARSGDIGARDAFGNCASMLTSVEIGQIPSRITDRIGLLTDTLQPDSEGA